LASFGKVKDAHAGHTDYYKYKGETQLPKGGENNTTKAKDEMQVSFSSIRFIAKPLYAKKKTNEKNIRNINCNFNQVKQDSSKWVNSKGFVTGKFSWQAGFGAFSYSKSEVPKVINYIKNQEQHHKTITFQDEYLKLLKELNIDYDDRFIFKSVQ
jgi:hypothetical protein